MRLAHGWMLAPGGGATTSMVREFIRPAIRAVPATMAQRLGECEIRLLAVPGSSIASRWSAKADGFQVEVMTAEQDEHDTAMELLLCLGQRLWEKLTEPELRAYWMLLRDELGASIEGEIDERALETKRALQRSRARARNMNCLAQYGRASFAGTAAEYVHCLWHEVTIRDGPEYLPAAALRRRLELLARWFPPDPGYRLFPAAA